MNEKKVSKAQTIARLSFSSSPLIFSPLVIGNACNYKKKVVSSKRIQMKKIKYIPKAQTTARLSFGPVFFVATHLQPCLRRQCL